MTGTRTNNIISNVSQQKFTTTWWSSVVVRLMVYCWTHCVTDGSHQINVELSSQIIKSAPHANDTSLYKQLKFSIIPMDPGAITIVPIPLSCTDIVKGNQTGV